MMKDGASKWWTLAILLASASSCGAQLTSRLGGVEVSREGAVTVRSGMMLLPPRGTGSDSWKVLSLKSVVLTAEKRRTTAIGQLPDATQRMNGIGQVTYVVVVRDPHDIMFVGKTGVGPTMRLEHLVEALRSQRDSQVVACSIEPREEGLARLQMWLRANPTWNPASRLQIEHQLGSQSIVITGTPANSLTARTMVLADYDMKRLSMGMVRFSGLPSYVRMAGKQAAKYPRWWIKPVKPTIGVNLAGNVYQLPATTWRVESAVDEVDRGGRRVGSRNSPSSVVGAWAQRMSNVSSRLD